MKKSIQSALIIFAVLIGGILPLSGFAQESKSSDSPTSQATHDPLMSLPDSDGVVSVDVQRMLNEMLPRVLADSPTRLAEVNERIDQIKARTGIDVRVFDRVAVGVRFVKGAKADSITVESVALARGQFNAPAMLAAGLLVVNNKYKYQQQKYGKKTIYVFKSDDIFESDALPQVVVGDEARKAGGKAAEIADSLLRKVMSFKGEIGIVALDENTLAVGQLGRVRAAIDAAAGRGKVDVALTQLATRSSNAVIGFGLNVPSRSSRFFGFDNDQIASNLDSIRQVYGFVSSTSSGFDMQNFVRTSTNAQAQAVFDMLEGFKELGGFFASNLSGDNGKLAQNALENLKISKAGQEVVIKLELAQTDVAMLVRVFDKRK